MRVMVFRILFFIENSRGNRQSTSLGDNAPSGRPKGRVALAKLSVLMIFPARRDEGFCGVVATSSLWPAKVHVMHGISQTGQAFRRV